MTAPNYPPTSRRWTPSKRGAPRCGWSSCATTGRYACSPTRPARLDLDLDEIVADIVLSSAAALDIAP
jgi:hypothetical protein